MLPSRILPKSSLWVLVVSRGLSEAARRAVASASASLSLDLRAFRNAHGGRRPYECRQDRYRHWPHQFPAWPHPSARRPRRGASSRRDLQGQHLCPAVASFHACLHACLHPRPSARPDRLVLPALAASSLAASGPSVPSGRRRRNRESPPRPGPASSRPPADWGPSFPPDRPRGLVRRPRRKNHPDLAASRSIRYREDSAFRWRSPASRLWPSCPPSRQPRHQPPQPEPPTLPCLGLRLRRPLPAGPLVLEPWPGRQPREPVPRRVPAARPIGRRIGCRRHYPSPDRERHPLRNPTPSRIRRPGRRPRTI